MKNLSKYLKCIKDTEWMSFFFIVIIRIKCYLYCLLFQSHLLIILILFVLI